MSERIGGSYDDALYKSTYTLLYLLQAMSTGSLKTGCVCTEASGGGGERDDDRGRGALKTPGNALHTAAAVDDDVELNQACRDAGLPRDSSSSLHQHANAIENFLLTIKLVRQWG